MKETPPIVDFAVGIACGALYLLTSSYSILSTEYMIRGGDASNVKPSFEVFTQIVDLWNGKYTGMSAVSILIAFLVWFSYPGINGYFEHYKAHLNAQNKGSGTIFITIIGVFITVDGYANWVTISNYPWPWYWQLTVSIGIATIIAYLGHAAIFFIMSGKRKMQGA